MDKELWQRVEEVFYAALDVPPPDREEHLRQACAGDDALRQQVRALLEATRQTENFLESPASLPLSEPVPEPARSARMKYCPKCQRTYPATARLCAEDQEILSLKDPYHLVGATLMERYKVMALVGMGGMGAVYSARHLGIDRRVAIKILQPNLAIGNEYVLELFEREARLAGRLSHENIVDVTDAGHTPEGIAYIAMEWLEGRTLEEELNAIGRFEFRRAVGVIRQIASALRAAHAERIIHRDLKPANIMLLDSAERGDRVKVLDFGIGKILKETTTHSSISALVGTPQYACPEQLTVGGHVDGRSDLYSLGVIFYRMLAGDLPFHYTSMGELLRMQLSDPPRPLGFLRPETPAAIETLIHRLLAKDPADRPQSASELIASLDRILEEPLEPSLDTRRIEASPTEEAAPAPVTTLMPRRSRRRMTLALAASVLLAGGYGAYRARVWESGAPASVSPANQPSPVPATPAPEPSPTSTPTPALDRSRPQANQQKAAERLARAQALYKQGEYQDALRECNESLRLDPGQAEARRLQRKINDILRILNAR